MPNFPLLFQYSLNLLQPNGHVMHHQFNIQQFHVLHTHTHTVFMCIFSMHALHIPYVDLRQAVLHALLLCVYPTYNVCSNALYVLHKIYVRHAFLVLYDLRIPCAFFAVVLFDMPSCLFTVETCPF